MDDNEEQHKSGERIAKVIARAGLTSRRDAEAWITAGRVSINGEVIRSPARNVTSADLISVDGTPLPVRERTRLFLYHKPRGLMTTHADPRGRPTIFQKLPQDLPRLISVGRLDFNTEGLLLLTNDGALARALELPATGWLRRYRVRAHGSVTQAQLDSLRDGITIAGIRYGAIEAALERVQGSNLWLTFGIREGKNREVRNVLSHFELAVTRLIRVSFGPFQLSELDVGAVEEVPTRVLREQLGERLVSASGADFSSPVSVPPPPPAPAPREDTRGTKRPPRGDAQGNARPRRDGARSTARSSRDGARETTPLKSQSEKPKNRHSSDHAWRAREDNRTTKKLRRKFRGARRDAEKRGPPGGEKRAEQLKDRKGRPVAVERYGQPPTQQPREDRKNKSPQTRSRRRSSSDRASGPRPHHPRGRR
jgi:23S rRNA pseudouridine2605 synthase